MKLHFIHKNLQCNIKVSLHQEKEFLRLWHYHPELELVYIVQGEGTLYAGDFIGNYRENDIFLLGKNVPHMFLSKDYEDIKVLSKAYVIHLNESFLTNLSDEQAEFCYVSNLLEISKRGVMFRNNKNPSLLQTLNKMSSESISENALSTLHVLLNLSTYEKITSLGSLNWLEYFHVSDKRLNEVIEYIMLNFKQEIGLGHISKISGMNKTAFCRFFKKKTGKSFVAFLNEIRINYSCKLLLESNPSNSISMACFNSGFNSLSYYNRSFKKVMGTSPSQYKRGADSLEIN